MSVYHSGAWYPQRSEEDLRCLELELQMVVSHNAGAGNRPWNLWYSSQSHSPHIQSFNKDNKDINCCLDGVSLLCPALELTEDVCTV